VIVGKDHWMEDGKCCIQCGWRGATHQGDKPPRTQYPFTCQRCGKHTWSYWEGQRFCGRGCQGRTVGGFKDGLRVEGAAPVGSFTEKGRELAR